MVNIEIYLNTSMFYESDISKLHFVTEIHILKFILTHTTLLECLFTTWTVCKVKMKYNTYLYHLKINILKGKRNAYFDFQNVGFIMSTNFVLFTAIYPHLYRQ